MTYNESTATSHRVGERQPPLTRKIRGLLPNKPLFPFKHPGCCGKRRYPKAALTSSCRNRIAPVCSLRDEEAQMSRTTRSPDQMGEAPRKCPQRRGQVCKVWQHQQKAGQKWHQAEHRECTGGGNLVMGHISWDSGERVPHLPPKKAA